MVRSRLWLVMIIEEREEAINGSRGTSKDAMAESWQVLIQYRWRPRDQLKALLAPKASFTSLS